MACAGIHHCHWHLDFRLYSVELLGRQPRLEIDRRCVSAGGLDADRSKVAGYIGELPVQDYERVHGGELLAQIVDVDYRAAVAQGEANVASAIAQSGSSSTEATEKLNTLRAQLSAQCRYHRFASNPSAIDVQGGATPRCVAVNSLGYKRTLQSYAADLDINC